MCSIMNALGFCKAPEYPSVYEIDRWEEQYREMDHKSWLINKVKKIVQGVLGFLSIIGAVASLLSRQVLTVAGPLSLVLGIATIVATVACNLLIRHVNGKANKFREEHPYIFKKQYDEKDHRILYDKSGKVIGTHNPSFLLDLSERLFFVSAYSISVGVGAFFHTSLKISGLVGGVFGYFLSVIPLMVVVFVEPQHYLFFPSLVRAAQFGLTTGCCSILSALATRGLLFLLK